LRNETVNTLIFYGYKSLKARENSDMSFITVIKDRIMYPKIRKKVVFPSNLEHIEFLPKSVLDIRYTAYMGVLTENLDNFFKMRHEFSTRHI
jgi:hypothetical protein